MLVALLLPGCAWLRGPVVCPTIPQPPASLLIVPAPLPPVPADMPSK
jgi:hypothetical protein